MSFVRLKVTEKSTKYFGLIKGRTGLTPNIISRMALCLSISDSSLPDPVSDYEKGQEFNRYTLLGEWDNFFIALLKERLIHDGLDPDKDLMSQFKAHLNRGVVMLFSRMKNLTDVYDLIPQNAKEIGVKSVRKKER